MERSPDHVMTSQARQCVSEWELCSPSALCSLSPAHLQEHTDSLLPRPQDADPLLLIDPDQSVPGSIGSHVDGDKSSAACGGIKGNEVNDDISA